MERVENWLLPNGKLKSEELAKQKARKEKLRMKHVEGKTRTKHRNSPTKNRTPWGWKFPDGREVCDTKTAAGKREYDSRIDKMVIRQGHRCRCGKSLCVKSPTGNGVSWYVPGELPTFGHDIPRGHGGARRDDRIELPDGKWINHAECFECNSSKGSRRSHEVVKPCPKKVREQC